MDRERSVIACPKFFQTFTTIAVQRLIVPDALAEEQSSDTIDMQNPLGDQRFALSAKAAAILFLGRRHPNHRANARSEEHTSELQSHSDLVCRLLLEKKK